MASNTALSAPIEPGSGVEHIGPESPFRIIYETHASFVWRTLRRYGVRGAELDDAIQDVFAVVHAKLPEFESRSTLRTWVFGIARRVARDHRPSARFEALKDGKLDEFMADLGSNDPALSLQHRQEARTLYQLLSELPPERSEAFILVELEQFSVPEAAAVLELNVNTLSSRLRAARQDLRQALTRRQAQDEWSSHARP